MMNLYNPVNEQTHEWPQKINKQMNKDPNSHIKKNMHISIDL